VHVPYTLARKIVVNEIWGIILKSGGFGNKVRSPLDCGAVEVDIYVKTSRQKRTLVAVTTKGKSEAIFTFICHPRCEPLFQGLKEFFQGYGLECEFLGEQSLLSDIISKECASKLLKL
jgi:hypothetical protein